jgi:hypothetical protein
MVATHLSRVLQTETAFDVLDCPCCGILHGVPSEIIARRRKDGQQTYCPNGHTYSWQPSEAEKLRQQVEQVAQERDAAQAGAAKLRAKAQRLENDLLDQVRAMQKVQARVHEGVCPHCHRTFKALARHMAAQHPTGEQDRASATTERATRGGRMNRE